MPFPVHEHCREMATQGSEAPWWAAFPEPSCRPDSIEPAEVFELLEGQSRQPSNVRDFLLVDVRRTDWTGGTVESSINLPAHSFYPTRKIVYDLCRQAGIKKVIFYCGQSHISVQSPLHRLTARRLLEWTWAEVCGVDARLHQRGWRHKHAIPRYDGRYQRLGQDVRGPQDGWVRGKGLGRQLTAHSIRVVVASQSPPALSVWAALG